MIQAFDVQVNVSRTAQRSVRRPALAGWHIWHRHLHTQLLTPTSPEEKRPKICPKIEKPQALTNIDGIIAESQALMAARGDLGVELELERVAKDAGLFVINATQMVETVESMIESPVPTRAEVSDLQNAIWDGTEAESIQPSLGQIGHQQNRHGLDDRKKKFLPRCMKIVEGLEDRGSGSNFKICNTPPHVSEPRYYELSGMVKDAPVALWTFRNIYPHFPSSRCDCILRDVRFVVNFTALSLSNLMSGDHATVM
ncbi:pyk [Symbiodinium sp. CCMP2592]|nr:pyk [Symbiodinium sp. CCMP2592]